ncbi:hypothetical protein [Sinomonas sp. B1-1]|uniref:hypothetical protein n=1 Tax=Sinomonas sp. B1-1 TaxID=3141454 RepID=UPI003D2DDF5C
MSTNLADAFAEALESVIHERPSDGGRELFLPWSLEDGTSITLFVQEHAPDLFCISDRGLAAASLAIAGIDLASRRIAGNWRMIRRSAGEPVVGWPTTDWEITAASDRASLGEAMTRVAEAVLRADGLRMTAPGFKARHFGDVVVQKALLTRRSVLPNADLRNKFGGSRKVTCMIQGQRELFLQALSGAGATNDQFDHARSVFLDAEAEKDQLVTVIAHDAALRPWQRVGLERVGRVVDEGDLEGFLKTAA